MPQTKFKLDKSKFQTDFKLDVSKFGQPEEELTFGGALSKQLLEGIDPVPAADIGSKALKLLQFGGNVLDLPQDALTALATTDKEGKTLEDTFLERFAAGRDPSDVLDVGEPKPFNVAGFGSGITPTRASKELGLDIALDPIVLPAGRIVRGIAKAPKVIKSAKKTAKVLKEVQVPPIKVKKVDEVVKPISAKQVPKKPITKRPLPKVAKEVPAKEPVKVSEAVGEVADIKPLPTTKGKLETFLEGNPAKLETKSIIRRNNAIKTREEFNVVNNSQKRVEFWDKQPKEAQIQFQQLMEKKNLRVSDFGTGKNAGELFKTAKESRVRLDKAFDMANEVDKVNYIENYFPHIWENPEKAEKFFQGFTSKFAKTPAFKKKRVIDLIEEGRNAGLKLKFTNPEQVVIAREVAGFQHKLTKNIFNELKESGLIKFKRPNQKPDVGFRDIDPRLNNVFKVAFPTDKGLVQGGRYVANENAARVIENYLTPGIWAKRGKTPLGKAALATFRGASQVKNFLVAMKLGFSGFHVVETGVSATASQLTLALKDIGRLNLGSAVKRTIKAPLAPITQQFGGNKLVKAWKTGKPQNTRESFFLEMMDRAGGRMDQSPQWVKGIQDKWKEMTSAMRKGQYGEGLAKAVPALIEKQSAWMMKHWVPNLKAQNFLALAEDAVKNSGKTGKELDQVLNKVWDSVDNRFGQLVYDNLFMNKVVKDLGVFAQISMGWNIGTFREFGGAGIDLAKILAGKATGKQANIITDRMLYTMSYVTTFGLIGASMTKAMTGENPKGYLDYFYPRTGNTNPNGSEERLQMPTMLKEVASGTEALRKGGLIAGTAQYAWHKTAPMFSMSADLIKNADFYGTEIFEEGAPVGKNVINGAEYLFKQGIVPISVSSMIRRSQTGELTPLAATQSAFGFSPAPGYVTKTVAQKEIFDKFQKRFGGKTRTREDFEKFEKKNGVKRLLQRGKDSEANKLFIKLKSEGIFARTTKWRTYKKNQSLAPDIRIFKRLSDEDQKNLLEGFDIEDRKHFSQFVRKNNQNNILDLLIGE